MTDKKSKQHQHQHQPHFLATTKKPAKLATLLLLLAYLFAQLTVTPLSTVQAANYTITADPTVSYQNFEGWGVSLAWWANWWGGLSDTQRNAIADAIFDPNKGLGLNVVRYNLGADGPGNTCEGQMRPYGNIPTYEPMAGNFNWSQDANQRWMLQAAKTRGANYFEAFVNSAPAWMLYNSCTAGATKTSSNYPNNLLPSHYGDYATYLATIVKYFHDNYGITFQSVEPFNEPDNGYWSSSGNQEGMGASLDQQNAIIPQIASALNTNGASAYTSISANDDTNIDLAVSDFNAYSSSTKADIAQINTHGYQGSSRSEFYHLGQYYNKRVWMSEWGEENASSPFQSALDLSNRITLDEHQMHPSAWVAWQASEYGTSSTSDLWGLVSQDSSNNLIYPPRYYALAQYSRFITPGFQMIYSSGYNASNPVNSIVAYNPTSGHLVIVTTNNSTSDSTVTYDLTKFTSITGGATPYRTSSTENLAQLSTIGLSNKTFSAVAKAQSITTYLIYGATAPSTASFNPAVSYTLMNANSGKVLDVYGQSQTDGASVDQYSDNAGTNQQWQIKSVGDGSYKLVNVNSGKVLEVAGFSTADGGSVDQWTDNGGSNQHWNLVKLSNSSYKLVNVNSGKVLEVAGYSTADGATVDQWTDNGGSNQHWLIVAN